MKQGKVKAIPVKKVTGGMQVKTPYEVGKIVDTITDSQGRYCIKRNDVGQEVFYSIDKLKTLVVEYDDVTFKNNDPKQGFEKYLKTIPLKYSQWQSAIDNGEVDSDKVVEFEFIIRSYTTPNGTTRDFIKYAKIIPQKNRMYTEDELREAMHFASSHLSSVRGINQYIEALNQKS